jgi:hypothetical protein
LPSCWRGREVYNQGPGRATQKEIRDTVSHAVTFIMTRALERTNLLAAGFAGLGRTLQNDLHIGTTEVDLIKL